MNMQNDYKLANIRNRELKRRSQRSDILKSDGQAALSKILDAPAPASLIQSFPEQDIYYLMHKIGPYDAIPILSLASSDQWEYILDIDAWNDDRLDIATMTQVFDLLFQADPQRLLRWTITQKPDFLEFYMFKQMEIVIREHDDPPPSDHDDYMTLDDKFYFRFPEKPAPGDTDELPVPQDHQPAWELIEKMIKSLAEMDLSVLHGLLQETVALLPAEVEEEQFRQKNIRLAEKGFLPAHEAVGIYQPARQGDLRLRPTPLTQKDHAYDPDIPLPPQFFSGFMEQDNLFTATLKQFEGPAALVLESELAALINKIISADKIKLRTRDDLEKAISKACSYLSLGLDMMTATAADTDPSRVFIDRHFLEDIFRTGSSAGIQLKNKAHSWFTHSFMNKSRLPLSFLGETYLGVIGGLLIERPMCYDQQHTPGPYREFESVSDISRTHRLLDEILAIDDILGQMDVDIESFTDGVLSYKTCLLTLWAKDRLGLSPNLNPIDTGQFAPFFTALFASTDGNTSSTDPFTDLLLFVDEKCLTDKNDLSDAAKRVISGLITELEEDYGNVDPADIDPRFIPHFFLI